MVHVEGNRDRPEDWSRLVPPAGVGEQGTRPRVSREPGRSCRFPVVGAGKENRVNKLQAWSRGVRRHQERTDSDAHWVPPSEGNEVTRDGRQEVGVSSMTDEAGEPFLRDPVEERRGRGMDPLEGTMPERHSSTSVYSKLQRIAELACNRQPEGA